MLGDKNECRRVHYIVHKGEIFLDKCDAFSALGRLYIVRCADYRKADRILFSHGIKPSDEYLYENAAREILDQANETNVNSKVEQSLKSENVEKEVDGLHNTPLEKSSADKALKRRRKFNRRTHVTLRAFSILVNSGFTDSSKHEFLKRHVETILNQRENLIKQCGKVKLNNTAPVGDVKRETKKEENINVLCSKNKLQANPSSSSGIESGNSSDLGLSDGSENTESMNSLSEDCKKYFLSTTHTSTEISKEGANTTNKCDTAESDLVEDGKLVPKKNKRGDEEKRKIGTKEEVGKGSALHWCRLLGRDVGFITMYKEVYLDLKAISNFFVNPKEKCTIAALMRKKSKQLHFEHPPFFPPRRFTKHSKNYVSLSCLATLVSKDLVKTIAGKKNQLLDDFKLILSKEETNPIPKSASENVDPDIKTDHVDLSSKKKSLLMSNKHKLLENDECPLQLKREKNDEFPRQGAKSVTSVNILGSDFDIQVARNSIFVDKVAIFELFQVTKCHRKHSNSTYRNIDRLLDRAKLSPDDAFLFEGRKRKFISVKALTILIETKFLTLLEIPGWSEDEKFHEISMTNRFLLRLEEIEKSATMLENKRMLTLSSFNKIEFRSANQTLFLKTLHYMQAVGFSTNYVYRDSPSKAYFILARLLKSRGLNLNACFLQHHKAKYGFISVYAAMMLFKTDFGPFKDKKRILKLKKELNNALTNQGFVYNGKWINSKVNENQFSKEGSPPESSSDLYSLCNENLDKGTTKEPYNYIEIGSFKLKYRIKGGNKLFLHRKTCFEAIGIEQSILSCTRGYTSNRGFSGINNILKAARIDTDKCYLKGKQEQYAYISLEAILVLLDSEDPLLVCLENKQDFADSLLFILQKGVAAVLNGTQDSCGWFPIKSEANNSNDTQIPFKFKSGKIFLRRDICYDLSGILEKRQIDNKQKTSEDSQSNKNVASKSVNDTVQTLNEETSMMQNEAFIIADRGLDVNDSFLKDEEDEFAFISINAVLVQTSLDGEISRVTDWTNSSKFFGLGIWTDLIAAISHEAPKLRIHVKMIEFREQLLETMLKYFIIYLNKEEKDSLDKIKEENGSQNSEGKLVDHGEHLNIQDDNLSKGSSDYGEHCSTTCLSNKDAVADTVTLQNSNPNLQIEGTSRSRNCQQETATKGLNGNIQSTQHNEEQDTITDKDTPVTTIDATGQFLSNKDIAMDLNVAIDDESSMISQELFNSIGDEIRVSCGQGGKNMIGEWLVECCDEKEINLIVNPGYSGSRKMSFLNPDVWAILRYQLVLSAKSVSSEKEADERRGYHFRLLINDRQVPSDLVHSVLSKSLKKGVFNLLYNLLILRPCFGSFNPELVETFKQFEATSLGGNGENSLTNKQKEVNERILDSNFIGSSQNGRTYAGTIRSTNCRVLAESRISDTCHACSHLLGVTINRSVLNLPMAEESKCTDMQSKDIDNINTNKYDKESEMGEVSSTSSSDDLSNDQVESYPKTEILSKTVDKPSACIDSRRTSSSQQVCIN